MYTNEHLPCSEPCWCFNCRRIANISCLESHLLIGIPIDKITLGDNLQNMVDDCKTNLGMASNRIRGVEENLELLANLLKAAENGIREKIKNNRNKIKHGGNIRKISPRLPMVLTWSLMPDSLSVNL